MIGLVSEIQSFMYVPFAATVSKHLKGQPEKEKKHLGFI
jgi:hypothetical protein